MTYKTFMDYVEEHGNEITKEVFIFDKPTIEVTAKIVDDELQVFVEGNRIEYEDEYDLENYLQDNYGAEIRFCTYCGGIMQSGMTDDGDFYNHEECFPLDMNDRYGEGNWRASVDEDGESVENRMGGYYEYRDKNGEWKPEPSYYTEWY